MQAGGGETVSRAGGFENFGREARGRDTPLGGFDLSPVRAERGDESGDEPRKRPVERRIHEGARLRITEDEIEALDRIEQSGRVFRAVGALDVEQGRRSASSCSVPRASAEGKVAD